MMKWRNLVWIIAVLAIGQMSCQNEPGGRKALAGTWEGYWGFDFDTPTYYEKWEIKKNNTLLAYDEDGILIAKGEWKLKGLDFEVIYTPTGANYTYTFSGLYHDLLGEIIGTWGETPSKANGGTFEMYKK